MTRVGSQRHKGGGTHNSCINDHHKSQVLPELWLSVSWQITDTKAKKLSFVSQ